MKNTSKRLASMVILGFLIFGSNLVFVKNYASAKAAAFKPYKVSITASKLYIRKTPYSNGRIVGAYYKGNIVSIIGQSGSYLRTSKGYILAKYTKKYSPPLPVKKDKYIKISANVQLYATIGDQPVDRWAVQGEIFKVLEEKAGYYRIKSGKIEGYIPSDRAVVLNYIPKSSITMGWNYIYSKARNAGYYDSEDDYINKNSAQVGLDVISPTWFYMTGDFNDPKTINAEEIGDLEYAKTAHSNGYEVWARFYEDDSERAFKIFYDDSVRTRIIDQILDYSQTYDVDGINIDFENLGAKPENKDGFTAFVGDLAQKLKAMGIIVSVDVTKPDPTSNYSKFYDRGAIAKYADYLILMAYNEKALNFYNSGSTASYNWVENGIKDTLALGVPKEKLILAVPFYMTDYKFVNLPEPLPQKSVVVLNNSAVYNNTAKDIQYQITGCTAGQSFEYVDITADKVWYIVKYKSGDTTQNAYIPNSDSVAVEANTLIAGYENMDMKTVQEDLAVYGDKAKPYVFDPVTKQNIAEYMKDGLKHKVWLEDPTSVNWRMDLVNRYGLKGAAGWRLYYETEDVWEIIKSKLK